MSIFALAKTKLADINDGAIAQLVEQRTENPCVPGSNPGGTTEEAERLLFFVYAMCQPQYKRDEEKYT